MCDPTEGALYPFATKLGLNREAEQAASPRVDAIPFEQEKRQLIPVGARRASVHPYVCA